MHHLWELNKSNILAVGVLLISLGLYFQTTYNIEGNQIGEYLKTLDVGTFTLLVTILFWGGLIVVIVSILIRPKKRKIVVPERSVKANYRREAAYGVEEAVEPVEKGVEQPYAAEEESTMEYAQQVDEEEEKSGKVGEIIGFCPRCGAPVTEGIRYCRKCGVKLK